MVSKITLASAACAVSVCALKQTPWQPIQNAELAQLKGQLQAEQEIAQELAGATSPETTALELFGGSTSISGSGGRRRKRICDVDPKDNGCLCYQTQGGSAWFVPTDECGKCPGGSNPVETDYLEVYDIIANCKATGATQAQKDKVDTFNIEDGQSQIFTYFLYLACGGGNSYSQLVNTLCVCIDTQGEVYQSDTFEDNFELLQESFLEEPEEGEDLFDGFKPACNGGGTPVINASDYLHNFFGFCNAYANEGQRQQTCELEDQNDKIIKLLKKGGKSSSKRSKRYSSKW